MQQGSELAEARLAEIHQANTQHRSNISGHLDWLRQLAQRCDHVTEFGTGTGRSTVAFLVAHPRRLVSYDLVERFDRRELGLFAATLGVDLEFRTEDTRRAEIEETDLLFVDSTHTGDHLRAELAESRAARVRRWILLHDTVECATLGPLREHPSHPGVDYYQFRQRETGHLVEGLQPALDEFLAHHEVDWRLAEHRPQCCGMTLLERQERGAR